MGLLNVTHMQVTQAVVDLQQDLLKNPYYLFNANSKALPVEYYNLNTNKSTMDQALKIPYANLGTECPLRFNLIHDLYLCGIEKIVLNLENTEFGLEGTEITGESFVFPNTIHPYPGDYFVIKMIKKRYLFMVTEVNMDTLDNGANYYKANYKLTYNNSDRLDPLVVSEFNFVSGNIGTNFNPVISSASYNFAKTLDDTSVMLKNYFKSLYYNSKVQTYTFVFMYQVCRTNINSDFFYDPFMIEFIIKNKVLSNAGDGYEFLDHKTFLRPEFPIKYNRSIWRVIETKNKSELTSCKTSSQAVYIDDMATIFASRYENYFELNYNDPDPVANLWSGTIQILDSQVIGHILNDQLFDLDSPFAKMNALVKYFNNHELLDEDIVPLTRITEYDNDQINYFALPMIIFVLDYYIKKAIANSETN